MARGFQANEAEIVRTLIETKAVDFETIGRAFGQFGANATLTLDGEDVFCGTMRRFVKVYRLPDPRLSLEQLAELQQLRGEVAG
jgi:hypothetical protein